MGVTVERLGEHRARMHWDTCLHEAAHAVMDTRNGYSVYRVTVAAEPGFLSTGKDSCVSDGPLLQSIVAGNLAERLWGVGKYCRLHSLLNGAGGDIDMVALLESRKRGGERISDADRKAAMKVWQAE